MYRPEVMAEADRRYRENGGSTGLDGPWFENIHSDMPAQGVANYVAHGKRTVVVEISGGQVRARVVAGSLTAEEKRDLQQRLNEFQSKGAH